MKLTTPRLNYWMRSVSSMINFINFNLMCVLQKMLTTYFQVDLLASIINAGANAQYSRRKCLDIVSIPSEVKDETLEENVVGIFNKLGCSIDADWIEACQ